ncbi:DUF3717 domain-containing protein [Duganella sp. BuS-21]|uniref:DUF3717 domain-containing protein n=1 Tax=Duganella sp. BuS-21 TaxID=2943848 RepID=UPI0035A713A9
MFDKEGCAPAADTGGRGMEQGEGTMPDEIGIVVLERCINGWLRRCPPVDGELSAEVEDLATLYGQLICAGRRTVSEREVRPAVWRLIVEAMTMPEGLEGDGGSWARCCFIAEVGDLGSRCKG